MGKGQKLQTSSYKISKAWGCNRHIATIVNNTALHIWMLLTECILIVLITRKQFFCNYVWWWMLTRLTVLIISQYIQILNHYIIYLGLIVYVNFTLIEKLKWIKFKRQTKYLDTTFKISKNRNMINCQSHGKVICS